MDKIIYFSLILSYGVLLVIAVAFIANGLLNGFAGKHQKQ